MGVQEFFQTFFTILLNRCLHTKPVFAILVKMGCFFVQFVYLNHKKGGVSKIFLEGYHTYKPKIICYNMISRTQGECRVQSAECRVQSAECRMQSAECRMQNAELIENEKNTY